MVQKVPLPGNAGNRKSGDGNGIYSFECYPDLNHAVNADVPSLEAIIVEEHDPHVNPLGVKGVGEIAITGTVGAIANAVWHATGIRCRRFPIGLEALLGG